MLLFFCTILMGCIGGLSIFLLYTQSRRLKKRLEILQVTLTDKDRTLSQLRAELAHLKQSKEPVDLPNGLESSDSSDQAKSKFMTHMSHELRTPMNGVIGMIALAKETELTAEQLYYLDIADNSCQMMLTLLNDFLDISKIEEGKLALEKIPFSLGAAVDEVFGLLGESALKKGIEVTWFPEEKVIDTIVGDPTRLKQIFYNLLGNAIKFTEQGHIKLEVKQITCEDNHQQTLLFELSDTGIGIKQETQASIFNRFEQANEATTRQYGGTGLGLTLCRQLIKLMSGNIGVESSWGKGSTFWFSANFDLVDHATTIEPHQMNEMPPYSNESSVNSNRNHQNKSILVSDDSIVCLQTIEHYTARLGIKTTCINDAETFLAKLETTTQCDYEAVLIDINLPKAGLTQAIKKIKEIKIPFILMGIASDPAYALVKNIVSKPTFISKPLRFDVLEKTLDDVFHEKAYETLSSTKSQSNITKRFHNSVDPEAEIDVNSMSVSSESKKHRILVVDDNDVNQKIILHRLTKLGHHIEMADNGEMAIHKLQSQVFDLVFMDCHMPIMDGYTATQTIRAQNLEQLNKHLPIIAMTANTQQEDHERCLTSGMDGFITKPINVKALEQVLDKWLV